MSNKIPCGGFEFDDSLEIRDGKLSVKPVLDGFVVKFTMGVGGNIVSDKTLDEVYNACKSGKKASAVLGDTNDWMEFVNTVVNADEIDFFSIRLVEGNMYPSIIQMSRTGGNSLSQAMITPGVS